MEHSQNFEKVKNYYLSGLWDKSRLENAATYPKEHPWITQEELEEILALKNS